MKDYYSILGVSKASTKDDIKKAYRKLAHEFHPDKHRDPEKRKEAESKFKEINEAYQVLSNDEQRKQYDMFGAAGPGVGGGAPNGWDFSGFDPRNFGGGGFNVDMGEIFEDFFGFGGGGKHREKRGRDISIDIEIPFQESLFGTDRRVLIRKIAVCAQCQGSGNAKGSTTKSCTTCQGSGTVRQSRRTLFGTFAQLTECTQCGGKGTIPEIPCKPCGGSGVHPANEEMHIVVPPGIRNGEVIRMSGKGEAMVNGAPGDLYVKVHVLKHPKFHRENDDLVMDLHVALSDALVGADRTIETLEGNTAIKIPAGTQTGDMLRIRSKGFPRGEGTERGDLLLEVHIEMPKRVTKRIKEIAEEMRKEGL